MLSDQDKKNVRSGIFKAVGTLIVATVVTALSALWAYLQNKDPFVITVLLVLAAFLAFFAIALFIRQSPAPSSERSARASTGREARDPSAPLPMVGLANPIDGAKEWFLDWPNLAVHVRDVRIEARLSIRIDGQKSVRMRWGDADGSAILTIDPGDTRTFPLCVRNREEQPWFYDSGRSRGMKIELKPGVCYVCDETFLAQGVTGEILSVGTHVIEVFVHVGESARPPTSFWVVVPEDRRKPMTVAPQEWWQT